MKGEGLKRCSGTWPGEREGAWPQVDIHGNIQDVSPPTRRRLESKSVFIRRIVSAPRCSTAARLHEEMLDSQNKNGEQVNAQTERTPSGLLKWNIYLLAGIYNIR